MKKIVMINPPLSMEERYGVYSAAGSKLPPLGLCNLAAVVEDIAKVSIIDAPAAGYGVKETFDAIKQFNPDLIGITAVTISINNAANLARHIKEENYPAPIILGGPHITAVPAETLRKFPQFDFAVIGEGEETFRELVARWDSLTNLEEIRGLAFRTNGNVKFSLPRPFIEQLDTLPLPKWDLLPNFPLTYTQSAMRSGRFPSTSLITSRGCYGKCIFCDNSVFGRKIRYHSAEYVIKMIKYLIDRYGIKEISFYDDNFIVFPSRISKICETIINEKLDITWSCDARVDTVKSIDTLKMLKAAGCWEICYGIESGDQRILDEEKKNITLEKVREVVEWTDKAGIHVKGFFMMGHPLETEESLNKTIEFARQLPLTNAHVTFMTPFPGTELHTKAASYGTLADSWDRMNMWTPVFIPNGLSESLLLKYKNKFFREFYFRPRIIFNYLKMVKRPGQLLSLIKGFFTLVKSLSKGC